MKILTLLSSIIEDNYKDVFEIKGGVYASIPTEMIRYIVKPLLKKKEINDSIISEEVTASIIFDMDDISILICSKTENMIVNITEEVRQINKLPEIYRIYISMVNAIKSMADKE